MKKEVNKLWPAAFTLSGTIIGAGILGLPYVFSKSGYLIGLLWLFILGGIMCLVNLYMAETTLRSKSTHQLSGYSEKFVNKKAGKIMYLVMSIGVYAALLAYLMGEGQSLSRIFTGTTDYAVYFTIGFWFLMTLLLHEGLKGLKKIETYGVISIIIIIIGIFIYFSPNIIPSNLTAINTSEIFFPIGVILFAFLGFTSIPELKQELKGQEKKFKKAIIIGYSIPAILYILFAATFVGILGDKVTEVATLSFGSIINLLGIFTMLTSYFVLSFALKDTYKYDFKFSNIKTFLLVSLLPITLYLFVTLFNLLNFVMVLSIGGTLSASLTAIMILITNYKAKQNSERKPEFSIPINKKIIFLLALLFLFGTILVFVF